MELKKTITERYEKLSARERVMGIFIIIALLVVAPYMFLYSPSQKEYTAKAKELEDLRLEVKSLNIELQTRDSVPKTVEEEIKLPEAEDLAKMLSKITSEAGISGVDFISITPEGVAAKDGFIEMRLKVELRAKYKDIYDFIRRLRAAQQLFIIQSMSFETNDAVYPSGISFLRAVTYLKKGRNE